jgi:TolB protein
MSPAVTAWSGATISSIEPEPGVDGLAYIAYKVTGPVAGVWHYEYAIYNHNLDRGIQSFSLPLGCGITVNNLGFHAPLNHPGFSNDGSQGGTGFSNVAWSSSQTSDAVTWNSETLAQNQNANAIRWGTLYNFRFDSDHAPLFTNATIGFFKTGTPVTVGVLGPNVCDVAPSPTPTATASPAPTPPNPTPTASATATPPVASPTPTPSATSTPSPTPLPPAGNGKIVYQGGPGAFDIWVMNPDGSNRTNLTNSENVEDRDPDWSPDGTKILFSSTIDGPSAPDGSSGDLYVMNPDGSNIIRLTNATAADIAPAWSPDGTKIAFTRVNGNDFEVWVMDADGLNQVNLTNHPARDGILGVCWSPDGSKIAFTTDRDGDVEIYSMDADGSNQINLTNRPGQDGEPDWSPDGTKIAFRNFQSEPPGPQDSDIYVMDANGANQVRLSGVQDDDPAWSPDGTKIAFTRTFSVAPFGSNREIYVMDANGSNQINLTNRPEEDQKPDWQRVLPAAQALNLSTRMRVQTGDNVGIAGFIVTGNAAKRVLVRFLGPSLIIDSDRLADPVLELHGGCTAEICIPEDIFPTIINNNWRDTQEAEILATGLAPANNLESAIVVTLDPGAYTAIVKGNNNTSGRGLVEVYDLNPDVPAKLANISTRAFVSTGDDIVIAGFILGGNAGQDRIVARGIGPSMRFYLANTLANPTLELRDNNGALLSANNDWQDDPAQAATLAAAGLALVHPRESGLAATLPPGLYTALLSGVNNGTGVGLVEVYDLGSSP